MKLEWNPDLYDEKHSFVSGYGLEMISILNPGKNECILDVGCGTGDLTKKISDASKEAIGLDSSSEMIDKAKEKYPSLQFVSGDIRNFCLDRTFDAIFSNAVLHWIPDARAAIVNMNRHLKRGGRLVAEFGGKGCNETIINCMIESLDEKKLKHPDIHEVLYYPSISEYSALLENNGFEVACAALFDRPTRLMSGFDGLSNFLEMFYSWVLKELNASEKIEMVELMKERLKDKMFIDNSWIADYRRIRVVAIKKTEAGHNSV